tara:strand:+ start:230 stop:466 length:237 start_codon:yes stop_codon:yes gene_type:complete
MKRSRLDNETVMFESEEMDIIFYKGIEIWKQKAMEQHIVVCSFEKNGVFFNNPRTNSLQDAKDFVNDYLINQENQEVA